MTNIDFYLPRETVNDDEYLVIEIPQPSGSKIEAGDVIAVFETSKAAVEVRSNAPGYLHHNLRLQNRVKIGSLIAKVTSERKAPGDISQRSALPAAEKRFSKPADELVRKHNLDRSLFDHLELVKKEDVEKLLKRQEPRRPGPSGSSLKVVVVGGGGHAKMCIDILRQSKTFEILGIVDSVLDAGTRVLDVPVVGKLEELKRFYDSGARFAINGIGAPDRHFVREQIFRQIKEAGFSLPNLIHPRAIIEPSCVFGEGNQFMAGCVVGSAAVIADNCIVNSNAVVSHDCRLEDNVHVAPGAILGGAVEIGSNTLIGMGSTIYMHVRVGSRVTVVNGAHIYNHVPDGEIVRR